MENTDSERSRVCPTWKPEVAVSAELLRTRSTFSKSVMVSVAVSLLGTTELMFIEPGVKISGAYYRDVLLGQHLLPAIRSVQETSSLTMLQLTELVTAWSYCLAIHQTYLTFAVATQ